MPPRILIADDHEAMVKVIRSVLEYESRFEICGTAVNGAEAVFKARDLRPDLIILDLAMPVMNGLDAAREIAGSLPDVPILLFTMLDIPQVRLEAAAAGIREVLFKSAGTAPLVGALERALARKLPVRASEAASETKSAVPPEVPTEVPPKGASEAILPAAIAPLEATTGSARPQPSGADPLRPLEDLLE
jgi:DNA-binding NarL/FixJ family response regulator